MGYNASLYARQPIQLDAITYMDGMHTYVRDRQHRMWPCKKHAWGHLELENCASYLCMMIFTYAGAEVTSYVVHAAKKVPLPKLRKMNDILHDRLLARDRAGAPIGEDPLFLEVCGWVADEEVDASRQRKVLKQDHAMLLDELEHTGTMHPRLEFAAGWSYDIIDLFEECKLTLEEVGQTTAPEKTNAKV